MNQLRTVKSVGLILKRGNITVQNQIQRTIDETPLPRRPSIRNLTDLNSMIKITMNEELLLFNLPLIIV